MKAHPANGSIPVKIVSNPKSSISAAAVEAVTSPHGYVRQVVPKAKTHTLSWYQRPHGGTWEHKTRGLTQEEAEAVAEIFKEILCNGTGQSEALHKAMGIEPGTEAEIIQLTLTHA